MKKDQQFLKRLSTLIELLMVLAFFILGSTTNSVFAQNWDEIIKTVASDRGTNAGFGHSIAISGDYAIVGAWGENKDETGGNILAAAGAAYILKNIGGIWTEVQKIVASDRGFGDQFGNSVAISGDYAIVGAFKEQEDTTGGNTLIAAGSAYVFENNGGTWSEVQKIVASDRAAQDNFGHSVAISGAYAIVGAYGEDEDATGENTLASAGSAYIFENNGGTWSEVQKIVASDRGLGDQFGYSVAISGDYALVGARSEDEDAEGGNTLIWAGSAYIFQNNAATWSQVQKIVASDRGAEDFFGFSVAISEDYAIVGAYWEAHDATGGNTLNDAGSAYIFQNNSGTWSQVQKIVASDRGANDNFGNSVAISGNYAIVGASNEDEDAAGENTLTFAGSAYIFQNNAGTWFEVQKIVASDRGFEDYFGRSVAISEDYAIVGASWEDEDAAGGNTLINAGSAYVFKKCPATSGTDVQTACDSFTWIDGNTYTISNSTATYALTNAAGCDSVVTLDLTINSVSDLTTTTSGSAISANNANATYQWLDCDNNNAIIVDETGQTFTATANGNYAVELTENGCVGTSDCVAIVTVGILENSFGNDLLVYPNPTNGIFSIDLGANYENAQLLITDVSGKLIETKNNTQSQVLNLAIEEPAGIYLITILAGNKKAVIRMVKQ